MEERSPSKLLKMLPEPWSKGIIVGALFEILEHTGVGKAYTGNQGARLRTVSYGAVQEDNFCLSCGQQGVFLVRKHF